MKHKTLDLTKDFAEHGGLQRVLWSKQLEFGLKAVGHYPVPWLV